MPDSPSLPLRVVLAAALLALLAACAERRGGSTAQAPVAPVAGNLMANASFEEDHPRFSPWTLNVHADPDAFSFEPDPQVFRSGGHSLRVRMVSEEPFASAVQYFDVGILPARRLTVRAWVRGEALERPVYMHTAFFAFGGQSGLVDTREQGLTGTFDWTRLEMTFEIPAHTDRIETGVTTTGAGTLWIDDVELVPAAP
ncbi:MAG: hypothetical protein U0S76_02280 [Pseudoxanthomonas sp.]|nr:hypothetical protein [Pseudoxanthomonas sp.]